MYDEYIRKRLLSREPRMVYHVIVSIYGNEIKVHKRSRFRSWLALKLDIPEEKIKLGSLSHAIGKNRKKESAVSPGT